VQSHEIRLNYQQATQLVQVGRYQEALEILIELDVAKPNTENILYLMAVCHAKAGHKNEAITLCERLVTDFDHENAKKILKRLNGHSAAKSKAHKPSATNAAAEQSDAPLPEDNGASEQPVNEEGQPSDSDNDDSLPAPELSDDTGMDTSDQAENREQAQNDLDSPRDTGIKSEAPEKETQEALKPSAAEKQDNVAAKKKGRASRPLWLILLWSALLALIVAYVLYVYFLDPLLNPF